MCVCASVESVVSVYPLCHQSDRKKRRAEVQRQQAMARLQNEMALKEQNSMTLELRAAVEEALSAVFGRYPAEGSLFARQKYGINGNWISESWLICIYLLHTNQTNKMKWKIAGIILYLCCTLNRITLRGSRGEIGTYAWRRTPEGSLGKFITSQATKFWSTEVLSSEEAYASRVHQGWLEYWLRASVRKYERPNKESCCNFSDSVL